MKSEAEHEEVPKKEVTVETFGASQKVMGSNSDKITGFFQFT
jgi:hypothetical protein